MPTIDTIKYPSDLDGALRRPDLLKALRDFLGDAGPGALLTFAEDPPDAETLVPRHFARSARHPIKPPAAAKSLLDALDAQIDEDEARRLRRKLLSATRTHVERSFAKTILPAFYASRVFQKWHAPAAEAAARKSLRNPRKVAEGLGAPRRVAEVERLMTAIALSRSDEASKIADALIRAEKLPMTRRELLERVRKHGGKPDPRTRVDASASKLRKCGFEKAGSSAVQEGAKEMACAFLDRDRVLIRAAHKHIMKVEPKTSLAGQMSFDDMIAALRRHKVIP